MNNLAHTYLNFIEITLISILLLLMLWQLIQQVKLKKLFSTEQEKKQEINQQIQLQQQKFVELQNKFDTFQLQLKNQLIETISDAKIQQQRSMSEFKESLQNYFSGMRNEYEKRQLEGLQTLQDCIRNSMQDVRQQLNTSLSHHGEQINKSVAKLTEENNQRLKDISVQVERRLAEGFEKTTATFSDVLKRLVIIDEAQKKITELSSNVVSLQEILGDKKARGAFGETQLSGLIRNVLPEASFKIQHTLSNNKRADCLLILPEPSGNVVIDAKFPLESYRKLIDSKLSDSDRRTAEQQFRIDIRKHIQDIAVKYIITGETADGAVMFIPAESIFAEIHAHFPELVDEAHNKRVWLASPTTMMAILTTARAVLKDADTRKQVHIIQEHLGYLAKDFKRFQERMIKLAKHIELANDDVKDASISAQKISTRFQKIEKIEFEDSPEKVELIEN